MTLNFSKNLLGAGVAMAFVVAGLAPAISSAQPVKGAQLLMPAPAAAEVTAAPTMACGKCSSDLTSKVDTSARGAIKPNVLAPQHGCCDTTVKTVGIGKAARNVAEHNCTMGVDAGCCK